MKFLICLNTLVTFLIVFAASEIVDVEKCDAQCYRGLTNRLEVVEVAVRKIISALSYQKNDVFAPINNILEHDPAIRSILSLSPTQVLEKTHFPAATANVTTFQANSSTITKGGESHHLMSKSTSVENLKGSLKCSLAHLLDINTIDPIFNQSSRSSDITASITTNDSLEIKWPMLSKDCLKYSSGVWIRVYPSGEERKLPKEEAFVLTLSVPQKCLKPNTVNHSYSVALFPPSSLFYPSIKENKTCSFSLIRELIQCHVYTIEVIPNYQSFRGKTLRTEIVIPPNKNNNEENMKSLISVVAHSSSLLLNWEDNSGCSSQLTSFDLKIFQDGIVNDDEGENTTISIPRSCLKQITDEDNLFSLVLPTNNQPTCPIKWKPLDRCRKYKLDMSSQYSSTWNGPSSSWEIFTGQEGSIANLSQVWRSPLQHFFCDNYGHNLHHVQYVCQHGSQCSDRRDEQFCDVSKCKDGLQCGKQCVPRELVCNGEPDCIDGSDEGYDCSYSTTCYQLTGPTGQFSSQKLEKPSAEIHPDRISSIVQKTTVLISVEPNHQIWLSFDKFRTLENQHFIKIYDGPYSTSPLLLSHSGSQNPSSVRSSSSDLFVEFPSYYETMYGMEAFYISVKSSAEPFVRGCGGYVNGNGNISTPNYLANSGIYDCIWFIEARQNEDAVLLRMANSSEIKVPQTISLLSHPAMIVYDGWNSSGQVLYDSNLSDFQEKVVIYSISNKMLIHFKPPKIKENVVFWWNVAKISTPQCRQDFQAATGSIRSPNYPRPYPNSIDCRWSINVRPGSKIRLLFAFFETQERTDFVTVFDGPTVYSQMLFEKSGSISTPFIVNSSTNHVLIRFTSYDNSLLAFTGFLVVYSSV